jgi:hypothetical protein
MFQRCTLRVRPTVMTMNSLLQPRLPERSLEILNGVLFAATLVAALTGFVHHLSVSAISARSQRRALRGRLALSPL